MVKQTYRGENMMDADYNYPYYVTLENNHHYVLNNGETGSSYYTPAQGDANLLCREMNNQIHTIRKLRKQIRKLEEKSVVFEIVRRFDDRDCHVGFVDDEFFAQNFCNLYSDCSYYQIPITRYMTILETNRDNVPCCGNCADYEQCNSMIPVDSLDVCEDYNRKY